MIVDKTESGRGPWTAMQTRLDDKKQPTWSTKQGAEQRPVHGPWGPLGGLGMPWYVLISPILASELGALGRSFTIHR